MHTNMIMGNPLKFVSHEVKLDFNNVLIVPKRSRVQSRSWVDVRREFNFNTKTSNTYRWLGVPIVSSNMDTVTGLESFEAMRDHGYISCFPKHFNKEWLIKPIEQLKHTDAYMLSCGTKEDDYTTLINLIDVLKDTFNIDVRFVCIDIANGYLSQLADTCKEFRQRYPKMVITAGNVVTPEGVDALMRGGANIIKCGIGSSSVCETRLKAGVGYPQLSAVLQCAPVAKAMGGHLMSDGGVVHPADIVKAIVAGADFVMLGTKLAGHAESPGELIMDPKTNAWYKVFYGMASEHAVNKFGGGMKNYRTAEGKMVKIPYKGPLNHTINDINGSLRSACTYVDAYNLEQLQENGKFVLVSQTHNTFFK